jgi:glycosyltransferase involved in cell wall biosynthesis
VPGPRHVGFGALFFDPGVSGGTETYLRNLVPAIAEQFPALELSVFTTRRGAGALRSDGWTDFARLIALPCDEGQRVRRLVAEQAGVVLAARRRGVDVLHSLGSTGPALAPGVRSVITLHDVTFFRLQTFGRMTTIALKTTVSAAARGADVLIAISESARDEICAQLGLDPGRVVVVPHGPGRPPVASPVAEQAVRERLGLDGRRLVLCVSALRPHKNQRQLVEALPYLPADVVVLLAGTHELSSEALGPLARRLGVADRLRAPGYLPDADVEALWRMAAGAAFPTRAEGFGLPVLEAMRRGVPVACSELAVFHEVGGDVPHYFPLDDPVATAAAIEAAMSDGTAARRGRERAAMFSWEAAALGTYTAYERALCTSA